MSETSMASELGATLKVNDTFANYDDLLETVKRYEKANRVQFFIRDAKRLHRACPSVYEVVKDFPQLQYCSMKLACIHGGRPYKQRKKDWTRNRKEKGTWRQGCKAEIYIKLNDEKDKLIITKMDEEHNHNIPSDEVFKQFPRIRRVYSEKHQVNRKKRYLSKFQERLEGKTKISVEDLVRSNSMSRSRNFEKVAKILETTYGCSVHLQNDEEFKVVGFFFQDEPMRKALELFPEILLVDGSYKVQNIKSWVFVFSVENAMGTNNIVGVGVLTVEEKESFDWLMESFVSRNPACQRTTLLIADTESLELGLCRHFPAPRALLCLPHAKYAFRKELCQNRQLNITRPQLLEALEFFERLADAASEDEYTTAFEEMEDAVEVGVTQYFYGKWHTLKQHWVRGFGAGIRAHVASKLEDPNSKLRSVITGAKTFNGLIERFFADLHQRRRRIKQEYGIMVVKVYSSLEKHPAERMYDKTLTPYAYRKIKPFFAALDTTTSFIYESAQDGVVCFCKDGSFNVTPLTCTCDFFTLLKLPCEHVLLHRKAESLDLFDKQLFGERWTRKYMAQMIDDDADRPPDDDLEPNYEERFAETEKVCLRLAALCADSMEGEFEERMDVLAQLKRSWENGDRVMLQTVEYASDEKMEDA